MGVRQELQSCGAFSLPSSFCPDRAWGAKHSQWAMRSSLLLKAWNEFARAKMGDSKWLCCLWATEYTGSPLNVREDSCNSLGGKSYRCMPLRSKAYRTSELMLLGSSNKIALQLWDGGLRAYRNEKLNPLWVPVASQHLWWGTQKM